MLLARTEPRGWLVVLAVWIVVLAGACSDQPDASEATAPDATPVVRCDLEAGQGGEPFRVGTRQQVLDHGRGLADDSIVGDPARTAELWQELLEVSGAATTPAVSEADLADFAAVAGMTIPEPLEAMLTVSDGADGAFGLVDMMGSDDIVDEWMAWSLIWDDLGAEDLFAYAEPLDDRVVAAYVNPFWIPLSDESSGNHAAIDLAPGPGGARGQIIYFGADETRLRVIATDLADFLQRQIDFARAGGTRPYWWSLAETCG